MYIVHAIVDKQSTAIFHDISLNILIDVWSGKMYSNQFMLQCSK